LPYLTYCIGALQLSETKLRKLNICWNDAFRRVFGFKRYKSVKELQWYCGEMSLPYIYYLARWNFVISVSHKKIVHYPYYITPCICLTSLCAMNSRLGECSAHFMLVMMLFLTHLFMRYINVCDYCIYLSVCPFFFFFFYLCCIFLTVVSNKDHIYACLPPSSRCTKLYGP